LQDSIQFLTPKTLAVRWVISERQVRDMAACGEVPALKVGKLWRFRPTDIERWEKVSLLVGGR
jgi:excisionase family DNA binding protein